MRSPPATDSGPFDTGLHVAGAFAIGATGTHLALCSRHHLPQEPGGEHAHRSGHLGGPDEADGLRGPRSGYLFHEAAQRPG